MFDKLEIDPTHGLIDPTHGLKLAGNHFQLINDQCSPSYKNQSIDLHWSLMD